MPDEELENINVVVSGIAEKEKKTTTSPMIIGSGKQMLGVFCSQIWSCSKRRSAEIDDSNKTPFFGELSGHEKATRKYLGKRDAKRQDPCAINR